MAKKKKVRKARHHGGSLRAAYSVAKREYHRAGEALRRAHGGRKGRKAKHRKGR
jgi:hypothetical protein